MFMRRDNVTLPSICFGGLLKTNLSKNSDQMLLSGREFEPLSSDEDQKSHATPYQGARQFNLESGALDHSATLTVVLRAFSLNKNQHNNIFTQ